MDPNTPPQQPQAVTTTVTAPVGEQVQMPDGSYLTVRQEITSGELLIAALVLLLIGTHVLTFFHKLILGKRGK